MDSILGLDLFKINDIPKFSQLYNIQKHEDYYWIVLYHNLLRLKLNL